MKRLTLTAFPPSTLRRPRFSLALDQITRPSFSAALASALQASGESNVNKIGATARSSPVEAPSPQFSSTIKYSLGNPMW